MHSRVPACVQQAFSIIARRVHTDCILNFIDLCSTANISTFLLTSQRYGFYIHGECVHGVSDVSLAMWYENFRAEEARFSLSYIICVLNIS